MKSRGIALKLPFDASPIMDFHEPAMAKVGNKLIVGYLADNPDCENPLESCEGLGRIYNRDDREGRRSLQDALALDRDDERDVENDAVVGSAEALLREIVQRDFTGQLAMHILSCSNEGYTASEAWKLFVDDFRDSVRFDYSLSQAVEDAGHSWDKLLEAAWDTCRENGSIGDPYAVILDRYEHSLTSWSVGNVDADYGNGTRADGVWVPDKAALDEAKRREVLYAYGKVDDNGSWTRASGKKRFFATVDETRERSPDFMKWHEAFQWLSDRIASKGTPEGELLRLGQTRAAKELANEALVEYNDWLAGNCFGVVTAIFENVAGHGDYPKWEFVSSDECWGYIGDEYAIEEVEGNVAAEVNRQAQSLQQAGKSSTRETGAAA